MMVMGKVCVALAIVSSLTGIAYSLDYNLGVELDTSNKYYDRLTDNLDYNWSMLNTYSKLVKMYKESHSGLNINFSDVGNDSEVIDKLRELVDEASSEMHTAGSNIKDNILGNLYVTYVDDSLYADKSQNTLIKSGEIIFRDKYLGKYLDSCGNTHVILGIYDRDGDKYITYINDDIQNYILGNNNIRFSSSLRGTDRGDNWVSEKDYMQDVTEAILLNLSDAKSEDDLEHVDKYIDIFCAKSMRERLLNEDIDSISVDYIDYGKSNIGMAYIDRLYMRLKFDSDDKMKYKDLELKIDECGTVLDFVITAFGELGGN